MNKKKLLFIPFLTLISLFLFIQNLSALSATVKSRSDYGLALKTLRRLQIMVENFPISENKNQYNKLISFLVCKQMPISFQVIWLCNEI